MRSDIDTIRNKFSEEEFKLIQDYLGYVNKQLSNPQKGEIVVGDVRYPLIRFRLRTGLVQKYLDLRYNYLEKQEMTPRMVKFKNFLDNFTQVFKEYKAVLKKGKTVKKQKRKDESKDHTK